MSFNQLPDELVSLIAQNMEFADVVHLLQTQKRVNKVLKRNGLDKPAFETVFLRYHIQRNKLPQLTLAASYSADGQFFCETYKEAPMSAVEAIQLTLSNFRSAERLSVNSTKQNEFIIFNHVMDECFTGRTIQIEHASFHNIALQLTPDNFVFLCKTFQEISFTDCFIPSILLTDKTLCKILPFTKFNIYGRYLYCQDKRISDTLLEALTAGRTKFTQFKFYAMRTNFTVNGIRKFIETLVEKNHACYINFGYLRKEEKVAALEWLNFADKNSQLHYKVNTLQGHEQLVFDIACGSTSLFAFSIRDKN